MDLDVNVSRDRLLEFNDALMAEAKEERNGQNKANAEARKAAEGERRRREAARAENRAAWAQHYEHMYYAHSALASSYAAKALALLEDGSKGAA